MKLIIGLGNPGKKYENTRHNIGTWLIDQLAMQRFNNEAILVKSSVFMNESGRFVKKLVDRYKIPLDDLLIIHDDLDVPLDEFRLQKDRGAAGHKGTESVIEALQSNNFWRLRIGIGRPPPDVNPEDYVLSKFSPGEQEKIAKIIPNVRSSIQKISTADFC